MRAARWRHRTCGFFAPQFSVLFLFFLFVMFLSGSERRLCHFPYLFFFGGGGSLSQDHLPKIFGKGEHNLCVGCCFLTFSHCVRNLLRWQRLEWNICLFAPFGCKVILYCCSFPRRHTHQRSRACSLYREEDFYAPSRSVLYHLWFLVSAPSSYLWERSLFSLRGRTRYTQKENTLISTEWVGRRKKETKLVKRGAAA